MSLKDQWNEAEISQAVELLNYLSSSISNDWINRPGNPMEGLGREAEQIEELIIPKIKSYPAVIEQLKTAIKILKENDNANIDPGFDALHSVQSAITSVFNEIPEFEGRIKTLEEYVDKTHEGKINFMHS